MQKSEIMNPIIISSECRNYIGLCGNFCEGMNTKCLLMHCYSLFNVFVFVDRLSADMLGNVGQRSISH